MILLPAFVSSKRKGVIIAFGCFVDDGRELFADPLAIEEDTLLWSSGVETEPVVWLSFEAYSGSLSEKNVGVSGLSSAVAEGVLTVLID